MPKSRVLSHWSIFVTILLGSVPALGSDFHSPRTVALGGAGHAGPLLNDAIYLNPSFTSFLPSYSVSLNYQRFGGPAIDQGAGQSRDYYGRIMNFSIQDGRSEFFQAGASYTRREDGTFVHLGGSKAFFQRWGVGVSGKFLFSNDGYDFRGADSTFSTSLLATSWFQVVAILDNALETKRGKDEFDLYRELTVGTKLNIQRIMLVYLDPHWTPSLPGDKAYGYEAGLEVAPFRDLFFRVGTFRNSTIPFEGGRGRGYGFGVGWLAPRISFDYGLMRSIAPHHATAHTFGTTIYF